MIAPNLTFATTFGSFTLGWNLHGLNQARFTDLPPSLCTAQPLAPAWILALRERIQRHLSGAVQDFSDTPLDLSTLSEFQACVYNAAKSVPAGEVRTYGWLATQIGHSPRSSRAVGRALGRNPWHLLVPCHRFIGANGKLTGFSAPGGLATKQRLLDLEKPYACSKITIFC